jgi:anthranilate phosphoribosyltransferase
MAVSPFTIVDMVLKLDKKEALTSKEMGAVMEQIITGSASDGHIEDFLLALRAKGETAGEIAAAAKTMRKHAVKLSREIPDLLDTCGTGGDGHQTLNVSTLSALVACAAGAKVAKHGNRSVSGVCGSADLLEMLGLKLDLTPERTVECIEQTGFGFFFAPNFHPATRYAMPARKKIKGKTLFNLLGPLANPAGATRQLVGVYDQRLVPVFAEVLLKLGAQRALVVHSEDGLDEISIGAGTRVAEIRDGKILEYRVMPEDFNMKQESLENLRVAGKDESLAAALKVLQGDSGAGAKIVTLNAAAALYVADKARSIKEGILMAMDVLGSGRAEKKLKQIVQFTQKA